MEQARIIQLLAQKYSFNAEEATAFIQEELCASQTYNECENEIFETIKSENDKETKCNIWKNSKYGIVDTLKANNVGNVGEKLLNNLCEKLEIPCVYNGTSNKDAEDGTYDMTIKGKRIEVKTARKGQGRTFQHESLRNNGCDYYVFVEISPEYYELVIVPKYDLDERSEVFGIKAHLRKGSDNVYKLTMTERAVSRAISNNYGLRIGKNTNICEIKELINRIIN